MEHIKITPEQERNYQARKAVSAFINGVLKAGLFTELYQDCDGEGNEILCIRLGSENQDKLDAFLLLLGYEKSATSLEASEYTLVSPEKFLSLSSII